MESAFLSFSAAKLRQLENRIHSCVNQLSDEQLWWRSSEHNNSVANLILHLCGNVGQWIIGPVTGLKRDRDRDAEFAARGQVSAEELRAMLTKTVDDAIAAIENAAPGRLTEQVSIQRFDVTILEAIYHAVEHFAMHTGQIIYATKYLLQHDLGFYRHIGTPEHVDNTP